MYPEFIMLDSIVTMTRREAELRVNELNERDRKAGTVDRLIIAARQVSLAIRVFSIAAAKVKVDIDAVSDIGSARADVPLETE